ncbi:hypothetical protein PRBRB14_05340 [Hallella multisaccharivorax DSM 17128]|uniref:4Fe4S-binding SPASM domain-containing protein n=1 Tax=Hallella multisaccharivorax DSM 17128 TaxID=688246 RepID=F8N676_9BACT|nr:grasp-with-spasm system SPASM domain peptide maturase [Hallella multisaccharivorax]EGN56157.1 hypothetical protein Premu_0685 [Hallella multisaccharivorax DSM 17128]GJG29655.1 hypothetical protein PRBRB14_05340 [Hallella multisaccharivorax DSM 17128]
MYLLIFPDIIITQGVNRTMIYDTKKPGVFLYIPNLPFDIINAIREKSVEAIRRRCNSYDLQLFNDFLEFIVNNKFGTFVDDITCFPSISEEYYSPSDIEILVIDINDIEHRYSYILSQLYGLCCQHLQLRFFSPVTIDSIQKVLVQLISFPWHSIELLVSYPLWENHEKITDFLYEYPMVSVVVFNQPYTRFFNVNSKYKHQSISSVLYTTQNFKKPTDCGVINKETLNCVSTLQSVLLSKKYNSCLYKKMFITQDGYIANCPCIPKYFGNIDKDNIDLEALINNSSFKDIWNISKDKIRTCCDCEYRYFCNDCRAFVNNNRDKPIKCSYNPFTNNWDD